MILKLNQYKHLKKRKKVLLKIFQILVNNQKYLQVLIRKIIFNLKKISVCFSLSLKSIIEIKIVKQVEKCTIRFYLKTNKNNLNRIKVIILLNFNEKIVN